MKITFVLLSPTYGMHQYTAHLAARAASELGLAVNVVTTRSAPADRYAAETNFIKPLLTTGTGFSREALDAASYRQTRSALRESARGGTVHFTGVHLWNLPLIRAMQSEGIPVIHTLHDLAPHSDARRGRLIRVWNRLLIRSGSLLLVHGRCFERALLERGVPPERIRCAPLVHGFWGHDAERTFGEPASRPRLPVSDAPLVLFFGRIEKYKGVDTLIEAWARLWATWTTPHSARLVIAGARATALSLPPLPPGVELRERHIGDAEGLALFREAALLVLPYRDATQSALIAAAARFGVPSLITQTGALAEYVADGTTGWVVPPGDPAALAERMRDVLSDADCLVAAGEAARGWYHHARKRELDALASMYAPAAETRWESNLPLVPDPSGGWHRQS